MSDTLNQSVTILTNDQQIQRLTDFFTTNATSIMEFAAFAFLAGFAIAIVAILMTFGIFKAFSIFNNLASL